MRHGVLSILYGEVRDIAWLRQLLPPFYSRFSKVARILAHFFKEGVAQMWYEPSYQGFGSLKASGFRNPC
jgi:hypothetical protein